MVPVNRRAASILGLLLISSRPTIAAIASTAQWEVRTGGADTNGGFFNGAGSGAGTDFSQQDAAQIAVTDLVTDGTSTVTSATANFQTTIQRNGCYITGGTGAITAAWYEVVTRNSSTSITLDRSTGLTAGTGATLNCGGGLLTLQKAADQIVSLNTIWVKSGTYTLTSTITLQNVANANQWIGYQTTHGDRTGTRPLVTTATNSTPLWTVRGSTNMQWGNFKLTNTAGTKAAAIVATVSFPAIQVADTIIDGCTYGLDVDGTSGGQSIGVTLINVEIANCSIHAVQASYTGIHCFGCYIHDITQNGLHINLGNQGGSAVNSIFYKVGAYALLSAGSGTWHVANSFFHTTGTTFTGNPFPAVAVTNTARTALVVNSIFYGGSGASGNHYLGPSGGPTNDIYLAIGQANAVDSVGMGGAGIYFSVNDVTLTADPATNAAAGDFTLNATAGGGAALKGVGFPGSIIGTTGTAAVSDIGPLQTGSSAGGGQKASVSVH